MRTKIEWPDTVYELSGMDRFCGGPSHEYVDVNSFYHGAKRAVDKAVTKLESEIDSLTAEVIRLKKELADKPRLKYRHDLGLWVMAGSEEK